MAFGYGIRQNIEDGYRYLMGTFEDGDKVFLFGFSRGAYTARALAGMIYKLGILHKGRENLVPYASRMYFSKDKPGVVKKAMAKVLRRDLQKGQREMASVVAGFKATFSTPCKLHFMGVWDTVGSLGPMLSKRFPDFKLNPDIRHAFQAIAHR